LLDPPLVELAVEQLKKIRAGHVFVIYLREGYPINVLNRVKEVQEVVRLFAATANPLQIVVVETDQGRGVVGVIDGYTPLGVENVSERSRKEGLPQEDWV